MAAYSYKCPDGHLTERIFPMGEQPAGVNCIDPFCSKMAARIYLPTAVSFNGSGFYKTDNRTKKESASLTVE
jgi:predicted nucleic acid-binding Zn ribbon protein